MWKPGINHIEFWVSDLEKSLAFYSGFFETIGWNRLNKTAFSTGTIEIYFKEAKVSRKDTAGPRHICFQAVERSIVDEVYLYLKKQNAEIIRGPIDADNYSQGYYTIDFRDPDRYVLEVAYTPNMEM
ncbi:VOC family protein [Bacillus sp. M6-12]|uniref:VOC family protein n=1 Tax=Bacillus sp. M6-12 TaxID=2054166 RepID=UPI0026BC5127